MSVSPSGSVYDWSWFWTGIRGFGSLPSIVLVSAFVGFGGLARDAGITFGQLIFMVPVVWALPSHLILVAGIIADASLVAIALAVTLASLRMLPMVMAFVPEVRVLGTKRWHLLLASNLVAITAWVNLMQHSDEMPRRGRLPYFLGFGLTMVIACTIAAGLVHQLAGSFPPVLMALLTFLTPLYFTMSIWNASRLSVERLALLLGVLALPAAYWASPQFAILIAGIAAGVVAFAIHVIFRARP
ncbi:MAG: AzlC family ABC transporter permease [Pseudomonadota bacterium]